MILEVLPGTCIDRAEQPFRGSRSSGLGGQNVPNVATRVTLLFDLEGAARLSAKRTGRSGTRLASRCSREGVLRVVTQRHRGQAANRREALERPLALLCQPLQEGTRARPHAAAAGRRGVALGRKAPPRRT